MPVYEYEHLDKACRLGRRFELERSVKEPPLTACPKCGRPVKKLISAPHLSFPKTNAELKDLGFTKLVKRDRGVYENVTARDGENRIMEAGDKSTYPNLKSRIKD